MGYLRGSKAHHSAGFARKPKFDPNDLSANPFADPSLDRVFFWSGRFQDACDDNLSPVADFRACTT